MKKIFILLLILLAACQKYPQKSDRAFSVVNVGTVANDGTGDPLRTAFQKVNANFLAQADTNQQVRDSLGNIYTEAQTRAVIGDTVDARLTAATDLETYVDTRLENFEGGGAIGMYQLKGIVATTSGFPDNGDSLIINSGFIDHPHIDVYRQEFGGLQWHNEGLTNNTGTRDSCYVFNSTTGTIIVRPAFTPGERVIVNAFDPIVWHQLTPEGGTGGGGGSGASSLLDSLLCWYHFDETTGSLLSDEIGTYDATATSITLGQSGKFGLSATLDAATDLIDGGDTGLELDTFSISVWVKTSGRPADSRTILSKRFYSPNRGFALSEGTDGALAFYVFHSTAGYGAVFTLDTINTNTWRHVYAEYDGANIRVYIDGVEDDYSPQAWTTDPDYYVNNTPFYVGNSVYGNAAFIGNIDAVGIWHRTLSSAEITTLQTKTYPFN